MKTIKNKFRIPGSLPLTALRIKKMSWRAGDQSRASCQSQSESEHHACSQESDKTLTADINFLDCLIQVTTKILVAHFEEFVRSLRPLSRAVASKVSLVCIEVIPVRTASLACPVRGYAVVV